MRLWAVAAMMILFLPIWSTIRGSNRPFFAVMFMSTLVLILLILGWSRAYKMMVQNMVVNAIRDDDGVFSKSVQLRPGLLLSATTGRRGVFSNSIVFIFSHSPTSGSKGVILNQRILPRPESNCHESPSQDQIIDCKYNDYEFVDYLGNDGPLHFFGGPVYTLEKVVMLHPFRKVRGCQAISLKDSNDEIYLGGLLSDVMREGNRSNNADSDIWIFHGFSAWGRGQLESEIQSGAWSVRQATYEDLIYFRGINDVL